MKKLLFFLLALTVQLGAWAQSAGLRLKKAMDAFEADSQLRQGISSLYVVELASGKTVFDRYSQLGLAPASCQKVITSATALELLQPDYTYTTGLNYSGVIENGKLKGHLLLSGSGDPTLGSWRYAATGDSVLLLRWIKALQKAGITEVEGNVYADDTGLGLQSLPDGYTWGDMGNYYGSVATALNWKENQYDLLLNSGKPGDRVVVKKSIPYISGTVYLDLKSGPAGSGDNAYIYLPPYGETALISGSIPPSRTGFSISGATPDPAYACAMELAAAMKKAGIKVNGQAMSKRKDPGMNFGYLQTLDTYTSPALDKIVYWLNRRSVNLYAEALLRTIGSEKGKGGNFTDGIQSLQEFWATQGIAKTELNIGDGSGLSPANRVTTRALVQVLRYAKMRPWFTSFYESLPEYNGMKMKSGTIGGVKGFTGYHKSKSGVEYAFSFLVNNYNGSSSALVGKMYGVLNVLK